MPLGPSYLDDDTLDLLSQTRSQQMVNDAVSRIQGIGTVEDAIRGIRKSVFGDENATSWTPLPIVVSPQPDAGQIAQSFARGHSTAVGMPTISSQAPTTPQTPATPTLSGGSDQPSQSQPSPPTLSGGSDQTGQSQPSAVPAPMTTPSAPAGDPSAGVEQWDGKIQAASQKYGVPAPVIKGIMHIESGGRTADAQGRPLRSSAGAISLMQVMPFHFQPGENPDDPDTNIDRGTQILADNFAKYHDWDKAAAAYFGAIDANGNITSASDGNTDGFGYVRMFRDAASRYQGGQPSPAPTAGAGPSAPAGSPSPSPAAAASPPAPTAAGDAGDVTLRDKKTGFTTTLPRSQLRFMTNLDQFDVMPAQQNRVALDGQPIDTSGPSAGDQKRARLAAAQGDMLRQPLGMATPGADTTTGDQPPVSSYNDPTAGGTLDQPLPPQQPDQTQPASYGDGGDVQQPAAAPAPSYTYQDGGDPTANGTWQQVQTTPTPQQPAPSADEGVGQYGPPAPTQSPIKPLWDMAGNMIGAVHTGVNALGSAAQGVLNQVQQGAAALDADKGGGGTIQTAGIGERGTFVAPENPVVRAMQTPLQPPAPQSPEIPQDAPPTPSEMTLEQRERIRQGGQLSQDEIDAILARRAQHTTLSPEDEARALPYQAAEAGRQSVLDTAQAFADAIRAGQEGRPLAAAGNALVGAIQTGLLPWSVASRTINAALPEMQVAGFGPGDAIVSRDVLEQGINGVNAIKNGALGRLLSPENMAAASDVVPNAVNAVRGIGARISGALASNAERVGAADARAAEAGSTVAPGTLSSGAQLALPAAPERLALPPPSAVAAAPAVAVADATQRPVLATEAQAIVNHLAGKYPEMDNPDVVNALAGQPLDRARRFLNASWLDYSGGRASRADFVRDVDEAMGVGAEEARGRVLDPTVERAGYGRRQTGGHADLSPLAEPGDQRYNVDATSETRQPIPTTVDDAPRGGSVNLNGTPGIARGAGLLSDVSNAIGGGVGGAAVGGGLPADTPEERRRNALIGAGAGMLLGPVAGRLMRAGEGGALATFGASPHYRPPTAAEIAAADAQGARRGEILNRSVDQPPSAVPRSVQARVATTDVNAGVRWAENVLSDAAGSPRLAVDDPARPSAQLRVNGGGVGEDRVATEMEPGIIDAGRAGLKNELPQYIEDMHQKDVLDDFYTQAKQGVLDDRAQKIAAAQQRGAPANVIARMQAKAQTDAEAAGAAALRRREGSSPSMTYPQIEARLQTQEARVRAMGGNAWQQLQDSAQAVWDHNAQTRQRLVDANLLDPTAAADWAQRFPHYVPTVPLSHLNPGGGGPTVARRAFSASRGSLFRELDDVQTAGERLNPIVSSRNATIKAEQMIQRNNVGRALGQMVDDAANVNPKAVEVGADHKTFLGGGTDITYFDNGKPITLSVPKPIADGLLAATNLGMPANRASGIMQFLMHVQSAALTAGRASFIPKNIRRDLDSYVTNTMAREGGPQHLPGIMGTWLNEAGKALADITAAQFNVRGGVGAAAGFTAGVTTGDPNDTPADRLKRGAEFGLGGAFLLGANKVPISGRATDFLARGGEVGNVSASLRSGQRWYRDVMRDGGVPVRTPAEMAAFLKDWGSDIIGLQGIKGVNERTELIAKTAAMRRAEMQSADPVQSMIAGRDVTYDPDIGGTMVRQMNTYVQFMNAMVQGGAQFARLWRNHPVAALASAATVTAPIMLAAEAWNRSDPQRAAAYDNVPQYAKDAGVVWMLPWAGSDTRGDRPQYIVDPTELSTPIVVALRGALQNLDKVVPGLQPNAGRTDVPADASDVGQWAAVLNEVLSVFHPLRGDSPGGVVAGMVPPGLREGVSLYQNKDLSTGNPIAPESASDLAGANARATAASRGIAGAANAAGRAVNDYTPAKPLGDFLQSVQPAQVEYGLRKVAPAYGDIATGASDAVAPTPYKQAEQGRPANEPVVGDVASAFVKDTPGGNLERSVTQAATSPDLLAALRDVHLRAGAVDVTVPPIVGDVPLNRDEQLEAQNRMNEYVPEELAKAQSNPKWGDPMQAQDLLKAAISRARSRATTEVIRTIPRDEQNDRKRQETDAKIAVGT